MARKYHGVKQTIIAFLESNGPAMLGVIACFLGNEWTTGNKNASLRKMLRQMVRAHLLTNKKRGPYALSPNYKFRGLDAQTRRLSDLIKFAVERGGIITRKEAIAAFAPDGDTYHIVQTDKSFRASPDFQQDFGRGVWNLSEERRAKLPFIGRWALWSIAHAGDEDAFEPARAEYAARVGNAFELARGDLEIQEVVADPRVLECLFKMADAAPGMLRRARSDLIADVSIEAEAAGITDKFAIKAMVRRRKALELPQHLYAHFEAGAPALHYFAPVELYEACAAVFGVCAGSLSRGLVVPVEATAGDGPASL